MLKEEGRASRAENRPFDQAIRSILANFRSTVHSPTGKTPAELMFGRRMRMPLDLLRLDPSERHVTFNFEEPRRDSSFVLRDKSEQLQLHQRVEQQQRRFKQYADQPRHAKSSNFQRGDRVRVRNQVRPHKLSPMYSAQHTVVDMPSEDSALLDNGTVWNAEHLKLDNSPTLEAPVVPQSASLDANPQLDEQLTFGDPLRYDAEVSAEAPASHDAPLFDNAQRAEQLQPATTEEPSSFHPTTMCSTSSASTSAAPSDELPDATDQPVRRRSPRPARNRRPPARYRDYEMQRDWRR